MNRWTVFTFISDTAETVTKSLEASSPVLAVTQAVGEVMAEKGVEATQIKVVAVIGGQHRSFIKKNVLLGGDEALLLVPGTVPSSSSTAGEGS